MLYSKYIAFILCSFLFFPSQGQNPVGSWSGAIATQGISLELIFNISGEKDQYTADLDVPIQGVTAFPLESVHLEGNSIQIKSKQLQMNYEGTLTDETIEGTYHQAGQSYPLVLKRTKKEVPGDITLPSSEEALFKIAQAEKGQFKYSVEDYFTKAGASSFKLSKDGNYLSYKEKDAQGKNHVYVKNIKTGEIIRAIEETDKLIRSYFWANSGRLIYLMDDGGNENYHLYAVNIDGTNGLDLTPFENVTVNRVFSTMDEDPDHMIIALNKNNPQIHEPYKININTGALEQLYENTDITTPIISYDFDRSGQLKAFTKSKDGINLQLYYKDMENGTFDIVKEFSILESTFAISQFDYSTDNPDDAYVLSNIDSDKLEIHRYDFKKNQTIERLFYHEDFDLSSMLISKKRNYEIDYYTVNGEKTENIPVSDTYKKISSIFEREFPEYQVNIMARTADEKQLLLLVESDRLYGRYYAYDVVKNSFTLVYDLLPQLKEEDMAEMIPFSFTSRDNKKIYAYITLPKGASVTNKVPLIVVPHGGPHGVRDNWTFIRENQLFASRGYATLQVNFRGSGGYGKSFLSDGYHQVGRGMMDDIEDGIVHVIEQGYIDTDKIAIFGASHGGYASLMGLIKTPDLYACAVDYVGVSNLFTFMNTLPPYWKPYEKIIKKWWYDPADPNDQEIMKSLSPALRVDEITKPLFVIQGANDPRVNIDESDQIVRAMRARGMDVPYMVKYNEGHGFAREENQIELYQTMMGFLAQHLK